MKRLLFCRWFVSLDQDYLDADAEEITEVEESEEDMEHPEVKPVFTYTNWQPFSSSTK